MRSLRPSRPSVSRGVPGLVTLAAALALAGCSGGSDDSGPPRLTPNPQYEVAAEMIDSRPPPEERLNACELLDLTTAEVIELTGADMPEVEPTGSGDLGLICTYGGPGSPERAESGEDENGGNAEDTDPDADTDTDTDTGTGTGTDDETATTATDADTDTNSDSDANTAASATTLTTATPTPTTATSTTATTAGPTSDMTTAANGVTTWDFDSDFVPDTFAGGVVEPLGGAEAALAGQPGMLGIRYACSDVRGSQASTVEGAPPAAADGPAPTAPNLATAYIDCIATPTGGGVEVHTILVVDDYLWHITLLQPEVPRTPETEAESLAGLHRVAEHILDQA